MSLYVICMLMYVVCMLMYVNYIVVYACMYVCMYVCAEFPMLVFDLERHTVDQWVKLSSSAIRCTLAPCKRGFVFVGWSWNKDAHATVFYFDGDRQYFFDPSGALEDVEDSEGVGIHEYFQSNHMWIPPSGLSDRRSQLQCVATALLAGEDQSIFACISSGKANML